jgi:predicted PurR-regulated permease PerM
MNDQRRTSSWVPSGQFALLALLLLSLYLAFRVIKPFLDPIIVAVVLAPIVHPVYRWLRARLGGRRSAAALLTCLVVVLVVIGPLTLLGTALVNQGAEALQALEARAQTGTLEDLLGGPRVKEWLERIGTVLPMVDPARLDLEGTIKSFSTKIGQVMLAKGGQLLSSTGTLLTSVVMMIFVLFFMVRDGEEMLTGLRSLSPLRAEQEERLITRFRSVSRSAILGTLGTAAAQGAAAAIGLTIVGLPGLFWGAILALTSLIPFVGTALVWVPAAGYLLATGHPGKAAFWAAWSILVIGTLDNFLRPILMKGEGGMSTLWMFFAVLGGLSMFGLLGLIYGPLIFGLCAVLLSLYRDEFADALAKPAAP